MEDPMHSVTVTFRGVAALCRSTLSKPGPIAWFAVLTAHLLASAASAGENLAGDGTVAEWRAQLGRSEVATASYAAGVLATGNVFTECKNRRTVRELHAYLLYRALSTLTMKQAISNFLTEADCTRSSEDRFMSSNLPHGKPGPTTDGE
jgi:hypothetical protein